MSIQAYNQYVYYDDRDHAKGSAVPPFPSDKTGITMDFVIGLLTSIGDDKVTRRTTTFTLVAETNGDDIEQDLADIINAGSVMASDIAAVSKGVLCEFSAKMGKFRADAIPVDVPAGDSSYGMLIFTNNENDKYGKGNCESHNIPVVKGGANLFIPWLRDDVSRQDLIRTFGGWSYTAHGHIFHLGQTRFLNENKTDMVAIPTPFYKYGKYKEYSRSNPCYQANNDVALGMADNVISEKFNQLTQGTDDVTIN